MILTVTPNPSIDLLFRADRLVWEDANRIPQPRRRPGGQGINVVRAVRSLDPRAPTLACAFLGGPTGKDLRDELEREGTPLLAVPAAGETRVFVGVREADTGRSLLLNPRGPSILPEEGEALLAAIAEALDRAVSPQGAPPARAASAAGGVAENQDDPAPVTGPWVAACGSVPPGLPSDFYASVGLLARERGALFVPDCDGPALAAAAPLAHMLVPNDMEAARLAGLPVASVDDAVAVGRRLLESGPGRVVVTLGERGGVTVTPEGAWWARPELPEPLAREASEGTAVGAGDAFLAALLLAGPEVDEPARLSRAVAAGTAVLLGRGSELVTPEDAARVLPHVVVEARDP